MTICPSTAHWKVGVFSSKRFKLECSSSVVATTEEEHSRSKRRRAFQLETFGRNTPTFQCAVLGQMGIDFFTQYFKNCSDTDLPIDMLEDGHGGHKSEFSPYSLCIMNMAYLYGDLQNLMGHRAGSHLVQLEWNVCHLSTDCQLSSGDNLCNVSLFQAKQSGNLSNQSFRRRF